MKLYLIRHAESQNNANPPHQRVEDPPLTARGRLQADHLAKWMVTFRHDVLITSPFRRTLETTRTYLDAKPQPFQIWHNVFENGGCFRGHQPATWTGAPGMGRQEILRVACADPQLCQLDETITDDGWWSGRDRETPDQSESRAAEVIDRLTKEFAKSSPTVAVIIHADFIRTMLRQMLRGVADFDRVGPMLNTGVSRLSLVGDHWQLDWLNAVSHLPHRLITGKEH